MSKTLKLTCKKVVIPIMDEDDVATHRTFKLTEEFPVEVRAPANVEVVINHDATTIWVNIEGKCLLRACKISKLTILDDRA